MLFSVIVANYNNGKYLQDLVESVHLQTYHNWELIIVDDFSNDDSIKILKPHLKDKRIKLVCHKKNKGAAAAFKTAFNHSKGEIAGMLGADDALSPNAIESMIKYHQIFPHAALICSNLFHCDNQLNKLYEWQHYQQPPPGGLINDITVGSFATFKRSYYTLTQGFNPFFKKALDHDLYLKLEEVGDVIYVPDPLYLYRENPIGISQNENWVVARQFSILAMRDAYLRRSKNKRVINLEKKAFKNMMKIWHERQIKIELSKQYFVKALLYKMVLLIKWH